MMTKHIDSLHDWLFKRYTKLGSSWTKLAKESKIPLATVRRMVMKGTGSIANWELVERYKNKAEGGQ